MDTQVTAAGSAVALSAQRIDLSNCQTARDMVRAAASILEAAGKPDAATDARRLVAHALGVDRAALLRDPDRRADPEACARLVEALARRLAHEPVARIIGERDFYGLSLSLGPATLDPRPDTETVVTVACHIARRLERSDRGPLRLLDLGTGTGAIALALLSELPDATAVATDISEEALDVARRNARRHGLAARARFIQSHWLERVGGTFHLIVANPPYIPAGDIPSLEPEVAKWDPPAALDGGSDGLDAYRAILSDIDRVLAPGGWAVFEVGAGQAADVAALAVARGLATAPLDWPLLRDLGGNIRCVVVATPGCDVKKTLGIVDRSD